MMAEVTLFGAEFLPESLREQIITTLDEIADGFERGLTATICIHEDATAELIDVVSFEGHRKEDIEKFADALAPVYFFIVLALQIEPLH